MEQDTRSLVLQWHITARCNLRCSHCYQEDYSQPELDLDGLLAVLQQFEGLLDEMRRRAEPLAPRSHIAVTGGEPLVREDMFDLLEIISAKREWLSFSILTNGTLIEDAAARRLAGLAPDVVQVSIEGERATNDRIRGAGTFDQAVAALELLVRARVPCAISFTAHKENSQEFGAVAGLGRDLGVALVWADRLIPWGSASSLQDGAFTPEETRRFIESLYEARVETGRTFCRTEIGMHRALQFLVGGGHPYRCAAGDSLITVQPNGDVFPCRRMPIRVGNLLENSLVELYYEGDLLRALRDRDRVSKGCEECRHARQCGGGLRCLAYALTGDPFAADPGCWHAHPDTVPVPADGSLPARRGAGL